MYVTIDEPSGSVVECLTGDGGVAGWSLIRGAALRPYVTLLSSA